MAQYHFSENNFIDLVFGNNTSDSAKKTFGIPPQKKMIQGKKKTIHLKVILHLEKEGYRWQVKGDDVCYQTDLRQTMSYKNLQNDGYLLARDSISTDYLYRSFHSLFR